MDSCTQLPVTFPAMGRCLKTITLEVGTETLVGNPLPPPVCGERCVVRCQPNISHSDGGLLKKDILPFSTKSWNTPQKQNKTKTKQDKNKLQNIHV